MLSSNPKKRGNDKDYMPAALYLRVTKKSSASNWPYPALASAQVATTLSAVHGIRRLSQYMPVGQYTPRDFDGAPRTWLVTRLGAD